MNKLTPYELLEKKKNTLYGVKAFNSKVDPEVSTSERTVKFVGNTYYWADSYLDVLVKGAAKKTIKDNGPDSDSDAKISHIADHKLDTDHQIGKFKKLSEAKYDHPKFGEMTGIIGDSFIPETQKGDDYLMNYINGMYTQHSIGFMYRDLILAYKKSKNEAERMAYDEFYPLVKNQKFIDEHGGFFYVVKEIELWEISTVMRGANALTNTLGVKSSNPQTALIELFNRMTILEGAYKSATTNKKNIGLQVRQIKQMMQEIVNEKPLIKGTFKKPSEKSTWKADNIIKELFHS